MLLISMTGLIASLIAFTPLFLSHTPVFSGIIVLTSAAAAVFSVWGIVDRRALSVVAAAGVVLMLANFVFATDVLIVGLNGTVGLLFFMTGVAFSARPERSGTAAGGLPSKSVHRQAA